MSGKVLCGTTCEQKIGGQVKYNKGCQQYGYFLGKDNVMWRLVTQKDFQPVKKWSKVPFPIDVDNGYL